MQSKMAKLLFLALISMVGTIGIAILIPTNYAGQAQKSAEAFALKNEELLAAIRDADAQKASALMYAGADANAKDNDGLTALMYAGADCVELLLAKGADPNAKSNS